MNKENLTPTSATVATAVLKIQEYSGGIGASLAELIKETKMDPKSIRGNLADLAQRRIIYIDRKELSGAACDLWYSEEYEE
jgi:hypothetical protein